MDKESLLRLVDMLHKDKDIDKDIVFQGIESALESAARKHLKTDEPISIKIDRETGEIAAIQGEHEIDLSDLGRITAQTAKQVIIQKIKEAERDVVFDEYIGRKGTIVSGMVQHFEGSTIFVNLGKTEGYLPKSEQISNEYHRSGERVRCLVAEVKKAGHKVKILLSRTHPSFVRQLFELEVPEIPEKIVEIKGLVREAGYRTKIAVYSEDSNVDCVGACVGVRGTRIKNIVDELNGEKIDIIRWDDVPEVFIPNTLKPAEVTGILLSPENQVATVVVPNDQLSLAIGKRGQNVRLASKLAGWDIDIITEVELEREREREEADNLTGEKAGEAEEVGEAEEAEEAMLNKDTGNDENKE
ncbi:MAG: nutilization substance protein A [Candidatus Scalindua rubra]|uniref:Transcription termination/antitermination protein NusA n=1 Tax=Candidatus Scalindua rubra TaxID=1872076 RepID=A0A1E3XCG9_9BACT|nr:MAG: nutilization substance protein A [Candidatus Scalindua rubra]